jgi:hypothetical protein
MSEIQHAGARKLLGIIARTGAHSGELTYRTAAKMMVANDYEKHSRAVAQMCDLLDAAACLAGVPLLALVAVVLKMGKLTQRHGRKSIGLRELQLSNGLSDISSVDRILKRLGKRFQTLVVLAIVRRGLS